MAPEKKHRLYNYLNTFAILLIVVLLLTYRQRFMAMLSPKAKVLVEKTAPEFAEGRWFNSPSLTLASLKGKVVVLDFWAFQCSNCRHILPTFQSWYEKYHDGNVVFIAIHTPETPEEEKIPSVEKFLRQNNYTFPVLTDNAYTNWNRYNVQFWPTTFLIDKQGVIRKFHYGELGYSSLEKFIQTLADE
jgi:thiol-disulfide isomerase/thioredoxin